MKKILSCLALCSAMSGYSYNKDENKQGFQVSQMLSHSAVADSSDAYPKGKVVKTMNVSGYTYFQFKQNDATHWAASNTVDIKEGDHVILMKSFPMHDFKSKALDRTFAKILFVSQLDVVR